MYYFLLYFVVIALIFFCYSIVLEISENQPSYKFFIFISMNVEMSSKLLLNSMTSKHLYVVTYITNFHFIIIHIFFHLPLFFLLFASSLSGSSENVKIEIKTFTGVQ